MSKILVQLSGGKDSIVVLHKVLNEKTPIDTVAAIYNDMGDTFPHVMVYIERMCDEWNVPLIVSRPVRGIKDSIAIDGPPSDLVPVWASNERAAFTSLKHALPHKIVSGIDCCTRHLFEPMHIATVAYKPDIVMRGSKSTDEHVTAGPTFTCKGLTYHCPLWNWCDQEVFDYIDKHEIRLPLQYECGLVHSLDCIGCTAWLEGASEPERVKFTREYYPLEYERLKHNMSIVNETVYIALDNIAPFKEAFYN